ncbi:hypothetical protein BDZ97DRAFT_1915275 [Flammula alnicola]|nr:hypothetical protein BDZ97DRAFT_1915275 [Flammula alnicola]
MPTRSGREYLLELPIGKPIYLDSSTDFSQLLSASVAEELAGIHEEEGLEAGLSDTLLTKEEVEELRQNPLKRAAEALPAVDDIPLTKKQSRRNERRAKKRERDIQANGHVPNAKTIKKYVGSAKPISTPLVSSELPVANGAYNATPAKISPHLAAKVWHADNLVKEKGFRKIEFDGKKDVPILDDADRIVAVLISKPNDHTYEIAATRACNTILREGSMASFQKHEVQHKRGRFPAINVGLKYGGGPTEPIKLKNGQHEEMVQRLLGDEDIQRLAHHQDAAFALWNPGGYDYAREHFNALLKRMPHLGPRNFAKSVFPNAAFNFGPDVRTYLHRDVLNSPLLWCFITAMGNFDPTKGGHLILWELKLVIEFPPGSVIAIPSATITHSNTPVAPGEIRTSFTQYCPGPLFRYIDNDFMTEAKLKEENPAKYEEVCKLKSSRWKTGLDLFSTIDELVERGGLKC